MAIKDNKCYNCTHSNTEPTGKGGYIVRCHKDPFIVREGAGCWVMYPVVAEIDEAGVCEGPGSCSHYKDSKDFIKRQLNQ